MPRDCDDKTRDLSKLVLIGISYAMKIWSCVNFKPEGAYWKMIVIDSDNKEYILELRISASVK